jgi:hypothetical protein
MREDTRAARLAAAQRALATAEANAGLRQRLVGVTTLARGEGARAEASEAPSSAVPPELLLPLPEGLAPLLPAGGLRRGTAVQVSGSTSLLLTLAAAAAEDEVWCALMAMPDVGLAAAAEAGLDLTRTVVVPRPGPDAPAVLGALIDGFDVVVVGRCPALSDADRRGVATRLRTREAVLLVGDVWPGAQAVLEVGESAWFGVSDGAGVLTGREVTVTSYARGLGAPQRARVRMAADGGVTVVPSPESMLPEADLDWARAG